MVFTPHMLVGAAIGSRVAGYWWLAFLLSLISHYLIDFFPHWEYKAGVIKRPMHIVWLLIDFSLGWAIILFFLWQKIFALDYGTFVIAGSVFFAELPDLFLFLEFNFKTVWTRPLVKFHHKIHNKKEYNFWQGLPLALVVSLIAIFILAGKWG